MFWGARRRPCVAAFLGKNEQANDDPLPVVSNKLHRANVTYQYMPDKEKVTWVLNRTLATDK